MSRWRKQFQFGADFLHPEFKQFVYGYNVRVATGAAANPGASTAVVR